MDKYVKDSDIYDIVMSQFCASSDETEAALNAIIEGTRALLPADVRPVVLCRECKHYEIDNGWCEYFNVDRVFGDYCSEGVKREES